MFTKKTTAFVAFGLMLILSGCGKEEDIAGAIEELRRTLPGTQENPWQHTGQGTLPTDKQGDSIVTDSIRSLSFDDGMTVTYDGTSLANEKICREEKTDGATHAVCMGLIDQSLLFPVIQSSAPWQFFSSDSFDGEMTCTTNGVFKDCATEVFPELGDEFSCESGLINGDKAIRCSDGWGVAVNGEDERAAKTVCRVHIASKQGRCLDAPKDREVTDSQGGITTEPIPDEELILNMQKSSWNGYRGLHFDPEQMLEGDIFEPEIIADLPAGAEVVWKSADTSVCTVDNDGSDGGEPGSVTALSGVAPDVCHISLKISADGFADRLFVAVLQVVGANDADWDGYDPHTDFFEGEKRSPHAPTGTLASATIYYRSLTEKICTVDRNTGEVKGVASGTCVVAFNSHKEGHLEVEIETRLTVNNSRYFTSFGWTGLPTGGRVGQNIDLSSKLPLSVPVADSYDIAVVSGDCTWTPASKTLSFQDDVPCTLRASAIKRGFAPARLERTFTPAAGTFTVNWSPSATGTVGTDVVLPVLSGFPDGTQTAHILEPGGTGCHFRGVGGIHARTLGFDNTGTCKVTLEVSLKGYTTYSQAHTITVSAGVLGAIAWGNFNGTLAVAGESRTPTAPTGAGVAGATISYALKAGSGTNCTLANAGTGQVTARAVDLTTTKTCTIIGTAARTGYTSKTSGDISIQLSPGAWGAVGWTGYGGNTATYAVAAPGLTAPTSTPTADSWIYNSMTGAVCSVNGSSGALTLLAAGKCVVRAVPQKTGYASHAGVERTITIAKGGQNAPSGWSNPYGASPSVAVAAGALSIDSASDSSKPTGQGMLIYQVKSGDTTYCSVDAGGGITALAPGVGEDCVIQAAFVGDSDHNPSPWADIATVSVESGTLGQIVWGNFNGTLIVGEARTPTAPTGAGVAGATISYALKAGTEANCILTDTGTGQVTARSVDLSTTKTCTLIGTASRTGYRQVTSEDISITLALAGNIRTLGTITWGSYSGTLQVGGASKTPTAPTGDGTASATISYRLKSGSEDNCILVDDTTGEVRAKSVVLTNTRVCTIRGIAERPGYVTKKSGDISITLSDDDGGSDDEPSIGVRTAKAVSLGYNHTCAILDDDSLKCWGYNGGERQNDGYHYNPPTGQLGVGFDDDVCLRVTEYENYDYFCKKTPTAVNLGDGRTAKAVSAGANHTCAILDNDSLKCWGYNGYGELGDGTTFKKYVPIAVNLGDGRTAKAVSAGGSHTCAILDDDSLKCWGHNSYGELGDGTTTNRNIPIAIGLGASRSAKEISAGANQTCAILDDDSLKCWGRNAFGELGDGTNDSRNTPTAIDLGVGRTAKSISLGAHHTCAILDDDSLKCWGHNYNGQLGDGTGNNQNTPTAIDLGASRTAKTISAGGNHTCVILDNDLAKCWGDTWHNFHQTGSSYHIDVDGTNIIYFGSYQDNTVPTVNAISTGLLHTCAIMDDDSLKCWGHNKYWELGTGSRRNELCHDSSHNDTPCRHELTTVNLGS